MNKIVLNLKQFDWFILITVVLLAFIGLVMIYSATLGEMGSKISKQAIALSIGLILFFILSFIDYRLLKNYAYIIYILANCLLLAVLLIGKTVRGMSGWFDLGFFQLQPSELAKFALLIILAKYFASVTGKPSRFKFIIVSGILVFISTTLVAAEPDLGTALIFIFLWLGMLLFSGIKKIYIYLLGILGTSFSGLLWVFLLKDYQKDRILSFINPAKDPLGAGYNMIQSKIAVGSGGLIGRGLGHGPQSQLNFLPEQHTDFIFAVLAEELGLVGVILLLGLFSFLFLRIIGIAFKSRDDFSLMLVVGVIIMFSFQILVNIGMNIGILPVTGVPLPFVSYGGSALITNLLIFGLLESIIIRQKSIVFR